MIIINTPNNPTASVFSAEDMRLLEGMLRDTDIVVVSDEVYEHIVFDGHQHQSVARFPGLAERSFVVSSFGKTYSVTGWKMGYVLAPKELMAEFRKVHQFNAFVANGPVQYALAEYMKNRTPICRSPRSTRKSATSSSKACKARASSRCPRAAPFSRICAYDAISDEKDTDLAVRLTKEHGVAVDPGVGVLPRATAHRVLRFCFAKSEETLAKGAEILCRL